MMYFQSLFAFVGYYMMIILPIIMVAMGLLIAVYLLVCKVFNYRLFSISKFSRLIVLLAVYSLIYLAGYLVQLRDISLININTIRYQQGFVMLSMLCLLPYLCHVILMYLGKKYSLFKHQLKS
jgi:hypothetical protein